MNPDPEKPPKSASAEEPPAPEITDMSAASFWDESQIRQVIRHAGQTGRSPEDFFNKKWKDKFIHHKPDDKAPSDGAN